MILGNNNLCNRVQVLALTLALCMFLPSALEFVDSHFFGVAFSISACCFIVTSLLAYHKLVRAISWVLSIFVILVISSLNAGGVVSFSIKSFVILFSVYLMCSTSNVKLGDSKVLDVFISLFALTMAYVFCLAITSDDPAAFVYGIYGDKNYLGLEFFLCFLVSHKRRCLLGVIVPILYACLCSDSRSLLGMLLLFILIEYIPVVKQLIDCVVRRQPAVVVFSCLFISTLLIYGVSLMWTSSAGEVSDYKDSWADESNFMRCMANVEAVEEINNNALFLSGYGDVSDLKDKMGIDEENPLLIDGVRLVQPHNCVINFILRAGLIPAILYFAIISCIVSFVYRKDNIPYIVPYMLNCLFMHSLLCFDWLFLWAFSAQLKRNDGKWKLLM